MGRKPKTKDRESRIVHVIMEEHIRQPFNDLKISKRMSANRLGNLIIEDFLFNNGLIASKLK